MVEKVQDMNLPSTSILRIIKDALPDGIGVAKDARAAIGKAATVFALYLTACTSTEAKSQNHKALLAENVFSALEEIDFENFIEPLREHLETYRATIRAKKSEAKIINTESESMESETEPPLN